MAPRAAAAAVLLAAAAEGLAAAGAAAPKLYFYAQGNLRNPSFLPTLLGWMTHARGCGYDGMFYADSDIQTLHIDGFTNATFHSALAAVKGHAADIGLGLNPLIYPFGPSDPIFAQPGWGYKLAEPLAFRAAPFVVSADRRALAPAPAYGGLANGDFSSHDGDALAAWRQDAPGRRTFAADGAACRGGTGGCLRIGPGAGDGEAWQELRGAAPLTQVHVSFWARTEGFAATQYNVEVRSLLSTTATSSGAARGRRLSWWPMSIPATSNWTRYDFVASTWDGATPVALFVGIEERAYGDAPVQRGDIWFDDVAVEETALVNALRRDGAPLRARGAGGRALEEGRDFARIEDPLLPTGGWPDGGAFSAYHPAPAVALPHGTTLRAGERVLIDYYAVVPVFGGAPSCLMHPGIFEYMRQSAAAVAALNPAGMLLSYDEIRVMHNDAAETAQFATAGELLAWHARNATLTARAAAGPATQLYVWDDMFNPYHNAGGNGTAEDGYFLVNGTLRGSWEGLDPEHVAMMTWGPCDDTLPPGPGQPPCRYRDGLKFFAGRGLRQVLGGYYDTHNGTLSAQKEWGYAAGVPGILGFSYTTWGSNNPQNGGHPDYTEMCPYAEELRRLAAAAPGDSM